MIEQSQLKPSFIQASLLITLIIIIITYSVSFLGWAPHRPLLIAIALLIVYGLSKGVGIQAIGRSIQSSIPTAFSASILFALIGLLISSWLVGGTIPTILYYSFSLVSGSYFFAMVFLLTAITGTVLGSSLTTVATVGVAFIAMAHSFDFSLAMTAGAIVSGAFFGDKMSPLSDTTNLAASVVKIDLFVHIRNMLWTTVLSPSVKEIDSSFVTTVRTTLLNTNLVHIYALLPIVILMACSLLKVKAPITLLISSVAAIVSGMFHTSLSLPNWISILYSGYHASTGVEAVDSFLNRGGIASMYFTIGLVILALIMGGLLFSLGIIQACLQKLEPLLQSAGQAITAAATTAIGINVLIGEQYLSLLLTGETFKEKFAQLNLHPKNLARVMEDAGTVINPLVPWSVCGIFIATMLDVPVMTYLPFAFFCLLSPVFTLIFGWLGWTITNTNE